MRSVLCVAYAFVTLVVVGLCSSVQAAFTTINAPIFPEDNRVQILSTVYGGSFSPVSPGSLNYTNGSINAIRIEDSLDPVVPSLIASNGPIGDDQVWNANFLLSSVEAVFAQYHQEFGYYDGASGGSYVKLFDVNGTKYDATGEPGDLSGLSGHTLRWAGGEGRIFSSKISENSDGKDHMVTYQITGLTDNKLTWLVMWEDKKTGEVAADFDFNDLVVQIKALPSVEVPEPAAASLVLLAGLLGLKRRR